MRFVSWKKNGTCGLGLWRGSELSERVRSLGKKHAVAVDVKFQGEAVFGKGGGEEVQISEQIFPVVDGGSGADAGAVI